MHLHFLLPAIALVSSTTALPILAPVNPSPSLLPPTIFSRALDFLTSKRSDWTSAMWGGGSGIEPGSYGDYDGDGEDALDDLTNQYIQENYGN